MCRPTPVHAGPPTVPVRVAAHRIIFCNQGPTRGYNAPKITTNVSETIEDSQEASPTLCQAITLVVFHQDAPEFSPSVLPRGDEWPALPARANNAHVALELTKTTAPDPTPPTAVGSNKRNSNHGQPTYGQTASPSPLAADVTSLSRLASGLGDAV